MRDLLWWWRCELDEGRRVLYRISVAYSRDRRDWRISEIQKLVRKIYITVAKDESDLEKNSSTRCGGDMRLVGMTWDAMTTRT